MSEFSKHGTDRKALDIDRSNMLIGRESACDLVLDSKQISRNHARIVKDEHGVYIIDLDSKNHTYVNGLRVKKAYLQNGDIIKIGLFSLKYDNHMLYFQNTVGDPSIKTIEKSSNGIQQYPLFSRSPRLTQKVFGSEIEINPPPQKNDKPEIRWLSILITPVLMVVISIVIMLISSSGIVTLLFIVPMSIASAITSILSYRSQISKHKEKLVLRSKTYYHMLAGIAEKLENNNLLQKKFNLKSNPHTKDCLTIVKNQDRCLWERRSSDDDFGAVRLGRGDIPSSTKILMRDIPFSLQDDPLVSRARQIKAHFNKIAQAAVTTSLLKNGSVGILGERSGIKQLTSNMLMQLATHHSYTDVKIVLISSEEEMEYWSWLRWLPHTWNSEKTSRFIAVGKPQATNLLNSLDDILKRRMQSLKDQYGSGSCMPFFVFVFTDRSLVEEHDIMKILRMNDPRVGVAALFLFNNIHDLPRECNFLIECQGPMGIAYAKDSADEKAGFQIDIMNKGDYETFARTLAPIIDKDAQSEHSLPKSITLMQGLDISEPDEFDILAKWETASPHKSLAVPIGAKENGDPFWFDIHEKFHGPHGLVAGMTGSGKSEILQTWIVSMSLHFKPQEVSFVIIDFKGEGLVGVFKDLPHIAGMISDLQENIQRNLISLESEIERRKRLFASASNANTHVKDIYKYQEAYRAGRVQKQLSHLIIIVDEFAELRDKFPDFLQALEKTARVGRSLGIHLVLATQKPSGVVTDQIWSNSRFKWCLKVADDADSKQMIKRSDAAYIPKEYPGRAYIQVGNDELFEQIQSYWSGAPYAMKGDTKVACAPIARVELNGYREKIKHGLLDAPNTRTANEDETAVIVRQIAKVTAESGVGPAEKLWVPDLPGRVYLEDLPRNPEQKNLFRTAIGLVDDPYQQKQYPFMLDLTMDGHTIIYGSAGSGKTMLLHSIAFSFAKSFTPDEYHLYVMDFGGRSMNNLNALPHLGGVANDNESEKINNLAKLIQNVLEDRKREFAVHGYSNIGTYNQTADKKLPYIVLLVDSFAPVLNVYPNLEEFFIQMSRESANYGIFLVLTATTLNSVHYRISQNFKNAVALKMVDRLDYREICGDTKGLEPGKYPGRGLTRGKPVLEFQAALAVKALDDIQYINELRKACELMGQTWQGEKPRQIPVMPSIIMRSEFSQILPSEVPLGLSHPDIQPVTFDTGNHAALISGTDRSGKSNLLMQFYHLFEEDADREMYCFCLENGCRYCSKCKEYHDISEADGIVAEIYKRFEHRKANREEKRKPIILLIDNVESFCSEVKNETKESLGAMVRAAKGYGIYIYATANVLDIRGLKSDPFVYPLINANAVILLGGCYSDHEEFDIKVAFSEKDVLWPEFHGALVIKGRPRRFKCIYKKAD